MTAAARQYVLLLGSNIRKETSIPRAIEELRDRVSVVEVSRTYVSRAVGAPGTADFHNLAVSVGTPMGREELRATLREIEAGLGRRRSADPNAPRTIDIDIVGRVEGEQLLELDPELHEHHHVTMPVAELVGDLVTVEGQTITEIARGLGEAPEGFRRTGIAPDPPHSTT